MATNQHLVRLGKLLQKHRQDKKLSLGDVSQQLKIGKQTLKSIEEADMNQLPSYVYLRGFVLSYARIVDLDEQEVLKEIKHLEPDSEETTLSKLPHPEEEEIISVQSKFISAISAVIILFCLAAILVITNFIRSQKMEEEGLPSVEESDFLEEENMQNAPFPQKEAEGGRE